MTTTTKAERELLTGIRDKCDALVADLNRALGMGFGVSFNLNGVAGKTENFEIVRNVKVDLSRELDS